MADNLNQAMLNKARKDKFILSFTVPGCLKKIAEKTDRGTFHKSDNSVLPDKIQYSVHGAVVPTVSVPSVNVPYAGQHLKTSGHVRDAYDDVTVSFTVDNQFNNYWYIYKWLDILNDDSTSVYDSKGIGNTHHLPYPGADELAPQSSRFVHNDPKLMEDYQTNFSLYGLNEYNKNSVEFTYTNAFPVSLGNIDYSYRDSSEIDCSFTFSFSQLLVKLL